MPFSPGVLQHGDARVGQSLSTVVDLRSLGAPAELQSGLEALRDEISVQRRRTSLSLFIGLPGNGQALAAASLGRAVGLRVLRVDLSAVISKYIGETEKNLDRVFSDAEAGNAMLFFDEADALFGSRTDVHDSHDRYANVELNYLLGKLEAFSGPAILGTSSQVNIDQALLRRVRHVLYFHVPLHPPKL
jgi:SpoVK/Ycf46/Vps4 family AAA+-type ATPase